MVTEYNVTDLINDECYNEYYKRSRNWNEYYENLEEEEDND
jgi:hypothetical protein